MKHKTLLLSILWRVSFLGSLFCFFNVTFYGWSARAGSAAYIKSDAALYRLELSQQWVLPAIVFFTIFILSLGYRLLLKKRKTDLN